MRRSSGSLELVWTMQELDTDTQRALARYSGESEGYLAGSGPGVAASWEARRWSLHLRNVSREDGGYYECQVGGGRFAACRPCFLISIVDALPCKCRFCLNLCRLW